MRLSIGKKHGHVSVRGGRLLRAAVARPISALGLSSLVDRRDMPALVSCRPLDLAVEVIERKGGAIIGHSFLSGPAIQIIDYGPARPEWHAPEPAALRIAEPPAGGMELREYIRDAMAGAADVTAFRASRETELQAERFMLELRDAWRAQKDIIPVNHLIGLIEAERCVLRIHFQPSHQTDDHAATPFQAELLLSSRAALR